MWKTYNPNPKKKTVGDCTVRAISKVLNQGWIETYIGLSAQGLIECDMPSSNAVWGKYLKRHGFYKSMVDGETVESFSHKNTGRCVLALSGHVVALIGSDYYDLYDSGNEIVLYVWRYEE